VKFKGMTALFALVLVTGVAGSAGASKASAAPGPAYCGALNMLHDPTMLTVPQASAQGIAGMYHAVAVSCS
jgi:hypothetical protein